ncbi:MAG: hypothetical protein ACREQM_16480, partial [Candidatus Dormibacteraceae bacterium]
MDQEGSGAPHYTPDGRWFWNGATWVPGRDIVAGQHPSQAFTYIAAPPPVVPAPPRQRRRVAAWQLLTALGLLVVLVAGGL